jgi:hypothetical protein
LWLQAVCLAFLVWTAICVVQQAAAKPRVLGLPLIVTDRATNASPR